MHISDREFVHRFDRGGSRLEDLVVERCQAFDCHFSLTSELSRQSIARNVLLKQCHVASCSSGPGILEDVVVNDVSTSGAFIWWGTFFHHVRFSGKIGRILINKSISVSPSLNQDLFDRAREAYYARSDWAIDISDARFNELDITGIPADLIRINPERHAIVRRDRALKPGWREKVRCPNDHWVMCIDWFLEDGDDSTVFVLPEEVSRSEYRQLKDSMQELRDLGVFE